MDLELANWQLRQSAETNLPVLDDFAVNHINNCQGEEI